MTQTAEAIEAEAAQVRSQLIVVGGSIRHQTDPAVIVDAAKANIVRRAQGAPDFLKRQATPIGLVVLGGALGALAAGAFSKGRVAAPGTRISTQRPSVSVSTRQMPPVRTQIQTALLSAAGLGMGYLASLFVPVSDKEEALLADAKAIVRDQLNLIVNNKMQGMKGALSHAFGVSRLSGTLLLGLAMLAEFSSPTKPRTGRTAL